MTEVFFLFGFQNHFQTLHQKLRHLMTTVWKSITTIGANIRIRSRWLIHQKFEIILKWLSKQLIESGMKKAEEISTTNLMDRTDTDETKPVNQRIGENLWYDSTSESEERYKQLNCEEAVKSWYSEQKLYIYGIPWPTIPLTRHFTQVVWKSTKRLGCAKSYNKKNVYVVCHYSPKGNAFSQYKNNVMNRNGKFVDIWMPYKK